MPLNETYYKILPYILPGIQCKYITINPLDQRRIDIQAGYGTIRELVWVWNKKGDKMASGTIVIESVDIESTIPIEIDPEDLEC